MKIYRRPVIGARPLVSAAVLGLAVMTLACSGDSLQNSALTSPTTIAPGVLASHTPGPPQTLPNPVVTADVSTCGQVTLSWTNVPTASGHAATDWHVQISADNFVTTLVNDPNYGSTSLTQTLAPGTYKARVKADSSEPGVNNSSFVVVEFTVVACPSTYEACSPGFWRNHPAAYTDATFESVFNTGNVSGSWRLSDALAYPGGTSPEPNPDNANFIGTGAYLSAVNANVDFRYTTAEVIDAVRAAHGVAGAGGTGVTIDDLAAEFGPGHVCPL